MDTQYGAPAAVHTGDPTLTVIAYAVYVVLSISATVWVATTLFRNGQVFLVDVFKGNTEMASAVNHLLVVGFYLINLGYVSLQLRIADAITSVPGTIEALSFKLGLVLVILGVMHLANVALFHRIRSGGSLRPTPTPVHPGQLPPPPAGMYA
jgi:hypothetical protein